MLTIQDTSPGYILPTKIYIFYFNHNENPLITQIFPVNWKQWQYPKKPSGYGNSFVIYLHKVEAVIFAIFAFRFSCNQLPQRGDWRVEPKLGLALGLGLCVCPTNQFL